MIDKLDKYYEKLQSLTNDYQTKISQTYDFFKDIYSIYKDKINEREQLYRKKMNFVDDYFCGNIYKESREMGIIYIEANSLFPERINSLLNMTLIYFITLMEGFSRDFFKIILKHENNINKKRFDKDYWNFRTIEQKLINLRFGIDLNEICPNYKKLNNLRKLRNKIVHRGLEWGKNINFDYVKFCFNSICEYFANIEHEIFKILKYKKIYSSFVCEYFESWEKEEGYRKDFKME